MLQAEPETHPEGRLQLLASYDPIDVKLRRGVKHFPRVGDAVYLADSNLLAELLSKNDHDKDIEISIGSFALSSAMPLSMSPTKLFGRHCGILGATGGGKSFTIARLLEQISENKGKAILIDPTGEFKDVAAVSSHYALGKAEHGEDLARIPYQSLTEDDLFALFSPSGQSQGPKLRDAIHSLKLVAVLSALPDEEHDADSREVKGWITTDGVLKKATKLRLPFQRTLRRFSEQVHNTDNAFEIKQLALQITNECVKSVGGDDGKNWGAIDQNTLSYCENLIARVFGQVRSKELECVFSDKGEDISLVVQQFMKANNLSVLRLSFRNVRFEHRTREFLVHILGRRLLELARAGEFKSDPVVVFLDEAHQFLNKSTNGDIPLDAFGLIAKEGRKYGLVSALATQRPRDIPADVLSQLGVLIVHRLTNDQDREVVERACGDLDRDAAAFIPSLGEGEALIVGSDLPAPIPVQVTLPHIKNQPQSKGPQFVEAWSKRKKSKK